MLEGTSIFTNLQAYILEAVKVSKNTPLTRWFRQLKVNESEIKFRATSNEINNANV